MTVLPVIVRELRASARQPFTYSLRLLGVGAMLLAILLFGLFAEFSPGFGRQLFTSLHCTLMGAVWVLVPMLTADCISRERREGTLGLLFLTSLQGNDIVVAKSLAHGLRAITLGLAVLPVLTVCLLVGGVGSAEMGLSVMINANAMCWALASGLLASAWTRSWHRSLLLAMILSLASLFAYEVAAGWLTLSAMVSLRPPGQVVLDWEQALAAGTALITNGVGRFNINYWGWFGVSLVTVVLVKMSVLSLAVLGVAVLAAGSRIRRSWRDEAPTARRLWWQRTFCTPVLWLTFFNRWMRRKLERNPIGWLEQRTWSGRLVTWGWIAVLVTVYSVILTSRFGYDGSNDLHEFLALLVVASMAASAAGSFRRERESGVLELLLVSPLRHSEIIAGRVRGLWGQFTPGAVVLVLVWAYCATFEARHASFATFCLFVSTFLTMPVFGLYSSLCCRNFLTALLATLAVGLLLPLAVMQLVGANLPGYSYNGDAWLSMAPLAGVACQLVLCPIWWWLLSRRLTRRSFPLERCQAG